MNSSVSLSQLLVLEGGDWVVARDESGEHSLTELRERVVALVQKLEGAPEATRWALVCESPWSAAIALLALLHANKDIAMPQNSQIGTLVELCSNLDGVVCDSSIEIARLPVLSPLGPTNTSLQGESLPSGRCSPSAVLSPFVPAKARITLYTSGSTGEKKSIEKRFSQLDTEVVALESVWGDTLKGCDIFATVSHQHIYGLLFGVLWPLATRRTFVARTKHQPHTLIADIAKTKDAAIVSCPAHLSRMPELVSLREIRSSCRIVFSSGGPLFARDSRRVRDELGHAPVEVFGSTETGGVAWRQQGDAEDSTLWTPLPQVDVSVSPDDNSLLVRSPFASADGSTWMPIGDEVSLLSDGRFRHKGRLDRIVKLEQKRLSLPELERRLMDHPWVHEAAVCIGRRASGRSIVAAVVKLSEQGEAHLVEGGRRQVSEALRESLGEFLERELWPKRFAYVQELPRNSHGKVVEEGLQSLFRPSTLRLPQILAMESEETSCVLELQVPEPLIFCDGHFAEKAIVPGVVQTGWVLYFASQVLQLNCRIRRMEAIKFQATLCPGDVFTLLLEWKEAKQKLSFTLKGDNKKFSSGRFVLDDPGGASDV